MSKNLTFKLVMDADVKNYVSNIKQSETVTKSVLTTIKAESDRLKSASSGAAEGLNALSNEARSTAQHVSTLDQAISQTNTELAQTDTAAQTAQKGIAGLRTGYTALIGVMGGIGIGLGIRELAAAADSYTNLSARINIATSEGGNFKQAMAGVHQVALMTNSSLDATAGLFTKVNDVGKQMGLTQQQNLDLVKTINMAIQTGGGSAASTEAAIVQFTQALQSGVLRGDEFNSIMEQAPGISKALARSLGVTTDELRKMAENGELSSEKVIKAIQNQSKAIEADYAKFPTTIGNALQRIKTQWEILIGTMDQSNGASATVAQWMVTIADNMTIVETLIKDIGQGFIWVGDQLKKIDPATIEELKTALSTAYDAVKSMASAFGNGLEIAGDQLNTILGSIFDFNSGIDTASDKTNGLTKMLQALNATFGFIADGFDGIGIVANLLAGVFYDVTAAWLNLKSKFTWGDTKKEIIADMEAMALKAQDYYDRGSNGAMDFKSKGIAAIQEISKTEQQKNSESVALSKDKLDQLLADQQAEVNGKKATEEEKLSAVQAYAEAAIKANGGVMDGVMQADLLTKGYIVTIDEAGKVSVKAGESAAQAAENAKAKQEALKLAKDNVKKADEEYLAFQKQAAVERALLEQQIEQAKKTGDLNALASAQTSINAINAKEAELANNRDLRIAELNKANTGSGQVAETAYSRAAAAAKLFGVDLDASMNKVSKSFNSSGNDLNDLKKRLDEAGIAGKQAGGILYQAWEDWLSKAKSQAEIDFAKAKLKEFGDQGQFSTSQVEQGLIAIKLQAQKLPDDIDPVTKAFKALGIETKENLKLAAQQALMQFITIRDSGKATAEGVQQAYEKMARAVAASGDAGVIAAANAAGANQNLRVEIDATGKASVKSMSDLEASINRAGNSFKNVEDGARSAGNVMREEAESAGDAWQDAVEKSRKEFKDELSNQQKLLNDLSDYESYSKADVISQLKSKGYSDAEAQKLAGSIWSQALEADREARYSSYGKGGFGAMDTMVRQEFDRAAAKGLTTQNGTNKINELLRQLNSNSLASVGSLPKTPSVDINSLAPNVSTNLSTPDTSSGPQNTTRIELVSGNKTVTVYGNQSSGNALQEMLRELEALKKST